jgi:uncharacterized protein
MLITRQSICFLLTTFAIGLSGCGQDDFDASALGLSGSALAQSIFPDQTGKALQSSLLAKYKPSKTLSYKTASDKIYSDIDVRDGMVSCVYTGYSFRMQASGDASEYARGFGMDIEHTLPQSQGADGNAKSDMHHLFPTRQVANSQRGNSPYGEIDDAKADDWYCVSGVSTSKPAAGSDDCSERDTSAGLFEPRHDHKGHVARALFYMVTMYGSSSANSFFAKQRDTLLEWNELDPPDAWELERTQRVAAFQDGKPNPFVLDATLGRRAFAQ